MISIYGAPLSATSHIYILFYSARVKSCKKGQNCLHTKSLYNEEKAFNEISDILSRDQRISKLFMQGCSLHVVNRAHCVHERSNKAAMTMFAYQLLSIKIDEKNSNRFNAQYLFTIDNCFVLQQFNFCSDTRKQDWHPKNHSSRPVMPKKQLKTELILLEYFHRRTYREFRFYCVLQFTIVLRIEYQFWSTKL